MGNVASVLSPHNRNILYPKKREFGCNCKSRNAWLNKCLTPKIVCQPDVRNYTNHEKNFYVGVSETLFKERFRNQKKKFAHKKYRNIYADKRYKYNSYSYLESSRKGVHWNKN